MQLRRLGGRVAGEVEVAVQSQEALRVGSFFADPLSDAGEGVEVCGREPGRAVPQEERFEPAAHGLGPHPRADIAGGAPEENAAELRALFDGGGRPAYRAMVVANAAAALIVAGAEPGWEPAIARADAMLSGGAARDRLARFIAFR